MMATREDAFYIPSLDGGGLYAFLVSPGGPAAGGVVMLGPLAEEKKSSLRPLVEICRSLAAEGFASLRVDFRGTGDSSGRSEDLTLKSAVEDARAAVGFATGELGWVSVALAGLRFGASVAALAASDKGCQADALALMQPIASGASYVRDIERQQSIRRMLTAGKKSDGGRCGDVFDFDGTALSNEFIRQLKALDLTAVPPERSRLPALVLQIGARKEPSAEMESVAGRFGEGSEAQALAMPPFWLQAEYVDARPAAGRIARFLAGRLRGGHGHG